MSKTWQIFLTMNICSLLIFGCIRKPKNFVSQAADLRNNHKQTESIKNANSADTRQFVKALASGQKPNSSHFEDAPQLVSGKYQFWDNFSDPNLNLEKWEVTRQGDFRISLIDIYDLDPNETKEYRLRLKADTLNTRDDSVKHHGVRCRHKIDFSTFKKISVDLDWHDQANGCYLAAAIYICPTITKGNPKAERDWLRIEYIGVPPGKNARCAISIKANNTVRHLYKEGWPKEKQGRYIAYQKIDIILDDEGFEIYENNKILYKKISQRLNFSSGYLYLQMSSHSNYPAREIYFDNIMICPINLSSKTRPFL